MYKISEIAEMVGGRLVGDPDVCVRRLLMDSRLLFFPEETMFVAIKSVRDDGHNYIEDLYRRNGLAGVVGFQTIRWGLLRRREGYGRRSATSDRCA